MRLLIVTQVVVFVLSLNQWRPFRTLDHYCIPQWWSMLELDYENFIHTAVHSMNQPWDMGPWQRPSCKFIIAPK
jgi:hypothetical protein